MKLDIRFRLLGPVEARRGGEIVDLGGPKQRAVLVYMLFRANRVCSASQILEAIWPDDARDRADTLHVYVAKLRKALDPERTASLPGAIETVRPGYRIPASPQTLDTLEFSLLARQGHELADKGSIDAAARSLRSALDLWQGDVAADLWEFAFVQEEAGALNRERRTVAIDYLETQLALAANDLVVAEAAKLVEEDPYDERLRSIQMIALYRLGRQKEALSVYRDVSAVLTEELGISPSPELQDLELSILNQDSSLLTHVDRVVDATLTVQRRTSRAPVAYLVADDDARHVIDQAVITIGRLPDRTVHLADEDVSRRHAEIRRTSDRFRIVDVGSTNGTIVNGEQVAEADLKAGDEVTIGSTRFVFMTDGEDHAASL